MKGIVVPELPVIQVPTDRPEALIEAEWLVTNGLGGYSSGTVAGGITRLYHGILVAALPNPLGRTVMLNALEDGLASPTHFQLEAGIPVWRFDVDGGSIEKRIVMPYGQNTVYVQYRAVTGRATLRAAPCVHFRGYEASVSERLPASYEFTDKRDHFELTAPNYPPLRVVVEGKHPFTHEERRKTQIQFAVDEARGFQDRGELWSPGYFTFELSAGDSVAIIASTQDIDAIRAMTSDEAIVADRARKQHLVSLASESARHGVAAQLVLAADQFVIRPVGRIGDTVRASAAGEEVRTVIAGYHWFTDWGRDTMISLEGLTLTTGRSREAGFILRTFARYVRDGLIPNLFPDGSDQGLYHTADATLWFFHALDRYVSLTDNASLIEDVLPQLRQIVDCHREGTRFGIGVDRNDGLLRQGADGYQLTWMDAKVDGWVVTPRRGKAVEINALWHNALCVLSRWERELGDPKRAAHLAEDAARARESFNARFWSDRLGHLYDVIDGPDGDDAACRPNQVLAISLPNPVLDRSRWESVIGVVQRELLTPVGLRSLAPSHEHYKPKYFGDLRTRDAAYHQGTVWGWLIGPWVDAWLKVHPEDRVGARRFLQGFVDRLPDFGVGSIAEIFDAESPHAGRGCIAQAWSVAEALRCLVKTS